MIIIGVDGWMKFKTIVVIGSRKYRNRSMMRRKLYAELIDNKEENIIVMSGRCPMKDSVDNWAIKFAKEYNFFPLEVPPREENTKHFFERNKIMAHYADKIIAFIPKNQYRSGTWNCISEFRKMGKSDYRVFDEEGKEWDKKW